MKPRSKRRWSHQPFAAGALAAFLMVLIAPLATADRLSPNDLIDADDPDSPTLGESLRLVDDAEVKSVFEKALVTLMEAGKTGEIEDLQRQLETMRSCKIDLPTPTVSFPLLPEHVYGATRASVLALGCIYKCGKCEHWHPHLAGGVILTDDGVAVTNYHVMAREDAGAFGAMTIDGLVLPITKILAASKQDDVAIVQMNVEAAIQQTKLVGARKPVDETTGGGGLNEDIEPLTPAILAHSDPIGSAVWAINHPSGRFFSLTTGVISRYYTKPAKGEEEQLLRLSITADFARGSSGCGVFNNSGKLTALISSTHSIYYNQEEGDAKNLQMVIKECIPAFSIKALIEEPEEE